ncbi:MAG: hypothetical protein N3E46_02020 [Gemmataceae bacterium]|uniref:Uncharacterized protein n=1 Tax=Thermogemmata fonticola TaxID=2755323 RepID=A0A7V8VFR2_9BACT|nr:hypothetical protein [Thermogemmata fonticola]MBA2227146.1 hypothetical protein [Thermogemmata fonticola]MCX8138444.1 hypothetical protein [Gemmataceae bacterium]
MAVSQFGLQLEEKQAAQRTESAGRGENARRFHAEVKSRVRHQAAA